MKDIRERKPDFEIEMVNDPYRHNKVLDIFKRYAEFMISCAGHPEKVKEFKDHPEKKLKELKFEIPPEVKVEVSENLRWAVLKIKPKDDNIPSFHVKEERLGVQVTEQWPGGEIYGLIRLAGYDDDSGPEDKMTFMNVRIEEEEIREKFFEKYDVTLKVPFIDPNKDLLGEIKLSDDKEIIMSTC